MDEKIIEEIIKKDKYNFTDLVKIMKCLRDKDGCPWDREQTHESIRINFIEETYEVIEAIDKKDAELLKEELGDVLMQVVFHTEIENEKNVFNIDDVTDGVCKKLILRHPHIFGEEKVNNSEDVLKNWEKIKNQEKGRKTEYEKLRSIPSMTPSLMRGTKVSHKSKIYENIDTDEIISKIENEIAFIKNQKGDDEKTKDQAIGNVLFDICALSDKYKIDPEKALYDKIETTVESFKK